MARGTSANPATTRSVSPGQPMTTERLVRSTATEHASRSASPVRVERLTRRARQPRGITAMDWQCNPRCTMTPAAKTVPIYTCSVRRGSRRVGPATRRALCQRRRPTTRLIRRLPRRITGTVRSFAFGCAGIALGPAGRRDRPVRCDCQTPTRVAAAARPALRISSSGTASWDAPSTSTVRQLLVPQSEQQWLSETCAPTHASRLAGDPELVGFSRCPVERLLVELVATATFDGFFGRAAPRAGLAAANQPLPDDRQRHRGDGHLVCCVPRDRIRS